MTPEAAIIEQAFSIVNKAGQKVPFRLNETQLEYDERRSTRDLIVKARQQGFSSFIDALIVLLCITVDNIRAVLIAHDRESTEKLFDRARFFINNLGHKDLKFKVDLTRSSRREFYFTERNSTFYIGTAGTESFGRGDTINLLHCSEVAVWPNPRSITAGLFQAVPREGTIWLESTANGRGNWFHILALKAREGNSRFKCCFYPWWFFKEYALTMNEMHGINEELSDEEKELKDAFHLTLNQLAWRREKTNEMDDSELVGGMNLFPQEYPATFDEAFLASGQSVFRIVPLCEKEPVRKERFLTVWSEPQAGHSYCLGVDVSAGVGADRSVIECIDCDDFEQSFEWVSDCVDPDELAFTIAELGKKWNNAQIVPELNNHGLATIETLRRHYPVSLIMQRYQYDKREAIQKTDQLGWLTTQKTKSQMITSLRKALRHNLKIYSSSLRAELSTFVQKDGGSLEAQDGCYDDRVVAMALAVTGYKHLYVPPYLVIPNQTKHMSFNTQRTLAIKQFVSSKGLKPSVFHNRPNTGFAN